MQILLADGEPNVRFGLRVLLEQRPGYRVMGEATDVECLLAQVQVTCPDVVLLDWDLGGLRTAELVAALRETCPDSAVIALSGRTEALRVARAAGVDACINKTDPPEQLLAAIQAATGRD